jgi:hypothetical protein
VDIDKALAAKYDRLVEASTYVQKVLSTIVHGTGWWTTDRRKVLEMIGDCDDRIRAALAPFTERRS